MSSNETNKTDEKNKNKETNESNPNDISNQPSPRKRMRLTIKNPYEIGYQSDHSSGSTDQTNQTNPINKEGENQEDDQNEQNGISGPRAKYYCENTNCDHRKYNTIKWNDSNKIPINIVNNIDDLIELGKFYHCRMRRFYNSIDLKILFSISTYLQELNSMVGLSKIKEEIVNMIIYLLIMKNSEKGLSSDMLHAVITGSPGCGKTTFIEIIAKIYTKLGVLKKGHIVKAKRSDLIGKYLGHTAVQTQKKIDDAKGGILLIDEAYSLGNPEGRDSFSKECIDTLNQALSEDKGEFICIIAGYKNALDNSFFNYNEGLRRRFPFRFDIESYNAEELGKIFMKKINEYNYWAIEFELGDLNKKIKDNYKYFENQGGDMETLFLNLKIVHNKRVFLLPTDQKKKLLIIDIANSIDKFIKLKGDYFKSKHETPFGLYV